MTDSLEICGLGEERGAREGYRERGAEHEVPRNPGGKSVQLNIMEGWDWGYILSFPGYAFLFTTKGGGASRFS